MSIVKAIVSFYRAGDEKPFERYKARVLLNQDHQESLNSFERLIIDFLGLKDQAKKFGLGQFEIKLFRLARSEGKTENYSIATQQQFKLELPQLITGESELNGEY